MKAIKNRLKRAFTIVELVVVIAVIAILAAVLIPTLANLLDSADESNDMVTVSNLNKIVAAYDTVGELDTVNDALDAALDNGYSVSALTPTSENNVIVYDANSNRFALLSDDYATVVYKDSSTTKDAAEDWQTSTTWRFVTTSDVNVDSEGYYDLTEEGISYILVGTGSEWDGKNVKTSYGVALYDYTGNVTLGSVIVENTDTEANQQTIKSEGTSNNKSTVAKTTIADGTKVTSIIVNVKAAYLSCSASVYTIKNYSTTTITKVVGDSKLSEYGTTSIYDASEIGSNGSITNYNTSISANVTVIIAEDATTVPFTDSTNTLTSTQVANIVITATVEVTTDGTITINGNAMDSESATKTYDYVAADGTTTSVSLAYALAKAEVSVGDTYYEKFISIASSLSGTNANGTVTIYLGTTKTETNITLLKDLELSNNNIQIVENTIVAIDLNNCTLTMSAAGTVKILVNNGATFTIDDSSEAKGGKITTSVSAMIMSLTQGCVGNLYNGILENTCTSNTYKIVSCLAATFNMTGGTIVAETCGSDGVLNVKGSSSVAAEANISGGTIENKSGQYRTIYVANGTAGQSLNISGSAKIIGSPDITENYGKGVIYVYGSTNGIASVDMSGGEIKCTASTYYAIYCSQYANISISGGTLNAVYLNKTSTTAIIKTGLATVSYPNSVSLTPTPINGYTSYSVEYTEENGYAKIVDSDGSVKGYYGDLHTAMTAASDGETVVLLKDCSYGSIASNKSITVDLNGYTISSNITCLTVDNGGTVNLINSSSTKSTIKNNGSLYALRVYAGGTITVGANIEVTNSGTYTVYLGEYGESSSEVATLNVYGTISNTATTGVAVLGYGVDIVGGTVINIYDGAVITSNGWGIYHPQVGTVNVYGGTISGVTGIEMRAGTLNIKGGTIISTATEFSVNSNGSGSTVIGAAIAVSQHTTQKAITVTISGGTISGIYALYETDTVTSVTPLSDGVSITINGGSFTGEIKSENSKVTDNR